MPVEAAAPDWFLNDEGTRLHTRVIAPSAKQARLIVFFAHRIGLHSNRKSIVAFAEKLAEQSIAVVLLDYTHHGYSGGQPGELKSFKRVLDDFELSIAMFALGHIYNMGSNQAHILQGVEEGEELLQKMAQLPFAVMGESTGAQVALAAGMRLMRRRGCPERFLGAVLIAGSFIMPKTTAWGGMISTVMDSVQRWSGSSSGRSSSSSGESSVMASQAVKDKWRKPDLLWPWDIHEIEANDPLAWGELSEETLEEIGRMISAVRGRYDRLNFPFMVIHDPHDGAAPYKAVKELLEGAPEHDVMDGRKVVECRGGMHDPITNAPGEGKSDEDRS
ncbi:unnamed protein product [Chrysoparadoxa australica]